LLFDVVFMAVCNLYWMRSEKLSQAKKKMIMASINAACSFNRCVQVSRLSTDVREFESSGAKKGQLLFLLC
jgi:hypothetical protein